MEWLLAELNNQRMHRDLFWGLARMAPLLLLAFAGLLAVPRYRRALRPAASSFAPWGRSWSRWYFITPTPSPWGGHASAIRYLDEVALLAGFAASAGAYAFGLSLGAAVVKLARRT